MTFDTLCAEFESLLTIIHRKPDVIDPRPSREVNRFGIAWISKATVTFRYSNFVSMKAAQNMAYKLSAELPKYSADNYRVSAHRPFNKPPYVTVKAWLGSL